MIQPLNFIIDKITNSIEKVKTGASFDTEVVAVTAEEIKKIHKKDGWNFSWKKEFREKGRIVYKLTLAGDERIQGLVSLEPIDDQQFIEMHLLENAPHNLEDNREFAGVAGNLVAFACKASFDLGYEGVVALTAKTKIIDHYRNTLGARLIYKNRMAIFPEEAKKIVNSYYKNYINA